MTRTVLKSPATRSFSADAHRDLMAARLSGESVLEIDPSTLSQDGFDYGIAMQTILTWGVVSSTPVLKLLSVEPNVTESLLHSDFALVACLLAGRVVDRDDSDITSVARNAALKVASNQTILADRGTENESGNSIILPSHIPRLSHSLELHTQSAVGFSVSEEARTLYHDIWPEPGQDATLRDAWSHLGEEAVPPDGPTHIKRIQWPKGHPRASTSEEFQNLARRTMLAHGEAMRRIQNWRIQKRPIEDEIGEVLFELFQNTEWHGQIASNYSNGSGCRIVRFFERRYSRSDILSLPDTSLADYLSGVFGNNINGSTAVNAVTIVYASVIDSGVGLARSAARILDPLAEFDEANEVNYLRKALDPAIKVSDRATGNIGLPRVQQLLTNLNGMMLIRSGGFELRRDFCRNPAKKRVAGDRSSVGRQFIDWMPGSYEDFAVGPRVGTDVTIAVPVDYEVGARVK